MNTPKLQLHVEQLFLRTTWRLAEWLFYNEGYKEKTQTEKRSHLVRTHSPVGDPEEEGKVTNLWSLSKEQGFQPHIGHLSPGVQHQEVEPPWLVLETRWAYQRAVGNQDSTHSVHPDLLATGSSTEASVWKVAGALDQCTETTIAYPPAHTGL